MWVFAPTSLSGHNVVEVDNVQDGLQICVSEAPGGHVLHRIWVDHLVPQRADGHVWPMWKWWGWSGNVKWKKASTK